MIKFFRKIRQKLISGNGFSKYLLYAIGEILLIVIGILIALQINNWNENQKTAREEFMILNDLKNSISTDIQQLNTLYAKGQENLKSSNILINWLENKTLKNDSLTEHFKIITQAGREKVFAPQNSAYKVLESKGIDLISNAHLKKQILDLYNIEYPHLNFEYQNYRQNIHDYGRAIARTQFKTKGELDDIKLIPIDYKQLLSSPEFYNTIKVIELNSESINGIIEELLNKCQTIEISIEREIEK